MAILEEMQAFAKAMRDAYQVGDAAACAAMFTENAELHSPYAPPARGRAEIEELHRQWSIEYVGEKRMTVLDAASSGDLAWCLLEYSEGGDVGNGTSLSALERQPDGSWLVRMISMNSTDV